MELTGVAAVPGEATEASGERAILTSDKVVGRLGPCTEVARTVTKLGGLERAHRESAAKSSRTSSAKALERE